ncbi:MAG: pyridoxal phosphate-dependent aminotransferase [Prevotella sp.]|nr:pyridoxal phosphate-dependent aminotransferase [Prevotella sp.]
MKYNFDEIIQRSGSGCYKYDTMPTKDIVPLWVADMDFRVAQPITDALHKRIEHGVFGYTKVGDDYYNAIISWFERRHQWTIQKEWIIYTTGVVPAVSAVIKALTSPGDKVLVQTPVYNCFFSSIRNNGCEVAESPLIYKDAYYTIDFEDFERQCADPKVRLFLLCNPHNPAGRLWTREELKRMNAICLRHNVRVIADEIHCELIMPGCKFVPMASVSQECLDNVVVCNSPSKSFNTAGLQVANIICNDDSIRRRIDRAININEVCDVNPFGPIALMAAYNDSEDWLDQVNEYIWGNYIFLIDHFKKDAPELTVTKLEGTYLVWVDIRPWGICSDELTKHLLAKGVMVNSGTMYGKTAGEGFIRINIALPRQRLAQGLKLISID